MADEAMHTGGGNNYYEAWVFCRTVRCGAAVVRLMSVPATRHATAISIFVSRERVDSAGTELVASFQIYVELISSL